MFGQVIRALIYLCFMVLAFYLIVWVLAQLGIALPPMVEKILMVILVLVAILVLYQLFAPYFGGINWWGRGPGPSIVLLLGSHSLTAVLAAAGMFLLANSGEAPARPGLLASISTTFAR